MTYYAKVQPNLLFIQLILLVTVLLSGWEMIWIRAFTIVLLLCISCLFFIQYSLKIEEDHLTYTVTLLNFSIYQKNSIPSNMKRITFKRVGWKTKQLLFS